MDSEQSVFCAIIVHKNTVWRNASNWLLSAFQTFSIAPSTNSLLHRSRALKRLESTNRAKLSLWSSWERNGIFKSQNNVNKLKRDSLMIWGICGFMAWICIPIAVHSIYILNTVTMRVSAHACVRDWSELQWHKGTRWITLILQTILPAAWNLSLGREFSTKRAFLHW